MNSSLKAVCCRSNANPFRRSISPAPARESSSNARSPQREPIEPFAHVARRHRHDHFHATRKAQHIGGRPQDFAAHTPRLSPTQPVSNRRSRRALRRETPTPMPVDFDRQSFASLPLLPSTKRTLFRGTSLH